MCNKHVLEISLEKLPVFGKEEFVFEVEQSQGPPFYDISLCFTINVTGSFEKGGGTDPSIFVVFYQIECVN